MADGTYWLRQPSGSYALDVPAGEAVPGKALIWYPLHGSPNQLWKIERVAPLESEDGPEVVVRSELDPTLYLARSGDDWILSKEPAWARLKGQKVQFPCGETVLAGPVAAGDPSRPAPATSCHIRYPFEGNRCPVNHLSISVKCQVEDTFPHTFFMTAGFHKGYSGIQHLGGGKTAAIFSQWHLPGDPVRSEDQRAVAFGGEGTGQKILVPFPWSTGEVITTSLDSNRVGDNWETTCTFEGPGGAVTLGPLVRNTTPYRPGTFCSFIEDFNRNNRCRGVDARRSAGFFDVRVCFDDEDCRSLRPALATMVGSGLDKGGNDRVECFYKDGRHHLATGGAV